MENPTRFTIKSFVFIDLETSHLLNRERPSITELSLIAINRKGLLDPDFLISVNSTRRKDATYDLLQVSLPRIVDKLTLCFDPRKETCPESSRMTQLNKHTLDQNNKLPFNEDVISMLKIFLSRQEAPVCLVAHYGKRFDFPILRSELMRLTAEDPFQDIFCVDSWEGFREEFATVEQKFITVDGQPPSPCSLKRKLLDDSHDATGRSCQQKNETAASMDTGKASRSDLGSTCRPDVGVVVCTKAQQNVTSFPSPRPAIPRPAKSTQFYPGPKPFSLVNIFKRTFDSEPLNSHAAEDDVVSLIKVLLPRVEDFASWADIHASKLNTVGLYYTP